MRRDLVDKFVADVKCGAIVVPKGSLARMLQDHVNKDRHITFFEKLVSRRKLNQELASLFAPREPRSSDKAGESEPASTAEGGQKRKRGRRRRSAKEALLSLLDNPELMTLMQQGGLIGSKAMDASSAALQLPHGLPAVSTVTSLPPQAPHATNLHTHATASAHLFPSATPTTMGSFLAPGSFYSSGAPGPTPALPNGPVGYAHHAPPMAASMAHGVPHSMRFAPAYMGMGMHAVGGGTAAPATGALPSHGMGPALMTPAQQGVYWNGNMAQSTSSLAGSAQMIPQQLPGVPAAPPTSAFSNAGAAPVGNSSRPN